MSKQKLPHQSMEQLKSLNDRAGYHYFGANTMRFFSSRVSSDVFAGAHGWYFVTSEQNKGFLSGKIYPRLYSVRVMSPSGDVYTVGEFQAYKSGDSAKRAAQRLAELSLSDSATCPTSNGRDLELWEMLPHTQAEPA